MIFVDTNVINRFLMQDIPHQAKEANQLFEKSLIGEIKLVSNSLVFFEVFWSLKHFYNLDENEILIKLHDIISSEAVVFENSEILLESISRCKQNNLGIQDNYNIIWSKYSNAEEFKSFDKKVNNFKSSF